MRIVASLIVFVILISSCEASFGDKYTKGNLEIYFTPDIDKDYLPELSAYFFENELVSKDQKQSILLTSDNNSFILKMILDPKYKKVPEDLENNVLYLENDIKHTIFDDLNFRIEITDQYFNPIQK